MKEREEVAVVTGAARGIGHRVSFVLAEERFRIAANELHEAAVRGMIEKVIDGFGHVD
jgi:NAD(P)-dependent dehydrogenase (short-subunit alcohol dehydrogenase family)